MESNDLEKYLLEQAKIEVDHTRAWPTKILAFYVAINFGLVSGIFSSNSPALSEFGRSFLLMVVILMSAWIIVLLRKNHLNYLRYRNVQVAFQVNSLESFKKKLQLPEEWFVPNTVSSWTRFIGWGFYAFLVLFIMVLSMVSIWNG